MNDTARPDYVTDVPYVRCFENDLSPSRLRLVAALNGFTPPPVEDFDYCELGSAHGDTTAPLAAAYPRARFVGVDLNPDHIASANRLAAGGKLTNLRFVEEDFEDLARADLPNFDFITAHGVVSWVGPSKRKALIDLAAAKLKPGGILHVSYNALPGWAAVEPLRQLIAGRAAIATGDSRARAREGVDLAKRMSELGAEYFTSNPAARAMLEKMEKLGLSYVAHEYLHAHWVPMYFAQVASEMAASGLHFVGQLPLYLNYRDLAIPEPLRAMFAGVGDRVAFESLKDFAINEYFRRDVFIKGRAPRADEATRTYLDATLFGGPLSGGPIAREAKLPHHTLQYAGAIFDALLPAIEEGAARVTTLAARPELLGFGLARVRDAVMRLALGEAIVPMLEPTHASATPQDARYVLSATYNRAALRDGLENDTPVALASTAAGTGLEVSSIEAVALFLLTEVPSEERQAWVRARCGRESFRLTVAGRAIHGKDEQVRVLLEEIDRFARTRLAKLVELGVLARA
jgi:ubiquinone/menaquinone biosynthesis C-methylase UbiE